MDSSTESPLAERMISGGCFPLSWAFSIWRGGACCEDPPRLTLWWCPVCLVSFWGQCSLFAFPPTSTAIFFC